VTNGHAGHPDQPEPGSAHPDPVDLALFADEALPIADARATGAHVSACATCQAQIEALRSLTARLASLPASPMPPEVVARIDAALVRAAADRPEFAPPTPSRVRRSYGVAALRWVFAGAGVAVAAAVAGVLVFGGQPSPGGGGVRIDAGAGRTPDIAEYGSTESGSTPDNTTGVVGAESLDAQVLALVARSEATETTPNTKSSEVTSQDDPPVETGQFDACVGIVGDVRDRDDDPVAAEVTTYAGEPAVLLVFASEQSNALDAYVVSVDCLRPGTASSAAVVLRKAIVDR
jgi:hypothetical protein